jgi:MoaA/NifB/PqqE/SkfB family radical SAM enzyme
MTQNLSIKTALENIYISPLESCNLNCHLCYTHKTRNVLSNQQILDFINRYNQFVCSQQFLPTLNLATDSPETKNGNKNKHSLKSILFCGGEVFILPEFTDLVNQLISQDSFITIITNGTIDRLSEIKNPQNCQLLVSLDGPQNIHDQNRGSGNFQKSIAFIKKALSLGFPLEVMFLVTQDSYPFKDEMPLILKKLIGQPVNLNYITQKTIFYTDNHPLSNQKNKSPALTRDQIIDIKKNYNSVPSKNFGCFQLSLQSNGQIYGCCESPYSLGNIDDNPEIYVKKFVDSLSTCQKCLLSQTVSDNVFLGAQSFEQNKDFKNDAGNVFLGAQSESQFGNNFFGTQSSERSEGASTAKNLLPNKTNTCLGCCCPDFLCGYKKELNLINCKDVVKSFK